ncbi:MAG: SNF7 family protein [Acholeplasmatales bacterium]|nr:SNF7 family protein [Acholeplasmatales bacterium]
MNETKRQLKMAENKQRANEVIRQFDQVINRLDRGIAKCREKAKEALLKRNDMNSFKLFARSMKYYQTMKTNIETVRYQFENYLIQVEMASSFVGLKDVFAKSAKLMDAMPSLSRNNKDFMKFKKSLLKGQISMDSINNMVSNMDPSQDYEMSEEDLNALKDEILMTSGEANVNVNTSTSTATNTSTNNSDFFSELDI